MTEPLTSASGRPGLAKTRDEDWGTVVRLVEALPKTVREHGSVAAILFVQTQIRSFMDVLAIGASEENERQAHLLLHEGLIDVMIRDDVIGARARGYFLQSIERLLLAPTLKAVFRATPAVEQREYKPRIVDLMGAEKGEAKP